MHHIPDPVRAGERHLGNLRHRHALGGQQDHLGPPPGHYRPGSPADDPKQPSAFVIVDLAYTYSFREPERVTATRRPAQHRDGASHHNRANVACYYAGWCKTMARTAPRRLAPLVTLVRSRSVAKVEASRFVVRREIWTGRGP